MLGTLASLSVGYLVFTVWGKCVCILGGGEGKRGMIKGIDGFVSKEKADFNSFQPYINIEQL